MLRTQEREGVWWGETLKRRSRLVNISLISGTSCVPIAMGLEDMAKLGLECGHGQGWGWR